MDNLAVIITLTYLNIGVTAIGAVLLAVSVKLYTETLKQATLRDIAGYKPSGGHPISQSGMVVR